MKWLGWLAAVAIGVYVFFSYFAFPTYTHRFRLSFQVEVDGKVREGTGVITVSIQDNQWLPFAQNRWHWVVRGPSPWVDLGEKGIVVAAMMGFPANYKPEPMPAGTLSFLAYFGGRFGEIPVDASSVREIRSKTGVRELKNDQLPQFIWIPHVADRASAVAVPPDKLSDMIGNGVRFVGAQAEITKDEPNDSLLKKLPWLAELRIEEVRTGRRTTYPNVLGTHHLIGDL
jgi:hypothetical protein